MRPNPSVVVAETETGPPIASARVACASARRGPTLGSLPMTCTATFATVHPDSPTSRATSRSNVVPEAPAQRGSEVPNTAPRSPNPAADSSASQAA